MRNARRTLMAAGASVCTCIRILSGWKSAFFAARISSIIGSEHVQTERRTVDLLLPHHDLPRARRLLGRNHLLRLEPRAPIPQARQPALRTWQSAMPTAG
jgi:hypothetical protein